MRRFLTSNVLEKTAKMGFYQRDWERWENNNHDLVQRQGNQPSVKCFQRPWLGKTRRGLQIFDTQVDFPVPDLCKEEVDSYIPQQYLFDFKRQS